MLPCNNAFWLVEASHMTGVANQNALFQIYVATQLVFIFLFFINNLT